MSFLWSVGSASFSETLGKLEDANVLAFTKHVTKKDRSLKTSIIKVLPKEGTGEIAGEK